MVIERRERGKEAKEVNGRLEIKRSIVVNQREKVYKYNERPVEKKFFSWEDEEENAKSCASVLSRPGNPSARGGACH